MEEPRASAATRLVSAKQLLAEFPDSPESERARTLRAELEEEIRKENFGKQWAYSTSSDAMSGRNVRSATVRSSNSFEFDFPYGGVQNARLQIRRHPRWGNDVIFAVERGQILCSAFGECRVRVRFDDEAHRTYKGRESSDNSPEYVFLSAHEDFVRRMARSKLVRIEVDIFEEGPLVAEFNVEGFDLAKLGGSEPGATTGRDGGSRDRGGANPVVEETVPTNASEAEHRDEAGPQSLPSVDAASQNLNPPAYPPSGSFAGAGSPVVVVVDVDANGNVTGVSIEKSSRNRDVDRAVIAAAKTWRYTPGHTDGVPISGKVRIPVHLP